ncbi:MAG TPA: polyphosphate kinase 2 family protein [Terriglobales bacterium]|nr:polyphosphate kinase 2 family protein [Terriglobales bacterium]
MKNRLHVVAPDTKVHLADYDANETGNYKNKAHAEAKLDAHRRRLFELQELLYAEDKRAFLVVLQGMDGAGKDGTIRHIFTGVNPQGCQVTSFKVPTDEELHHDFLWRVHKAAPRRGMIGIFNRSHYEDVLVVRVHQKLSKPEVQRRFEEINNFERELADNHTHILKFFLHISKDEQKKRLQARLDHPQKYWKVSPSDLTERQYWDDYVEAYEDVLSHCSTKYAPWYIVPANHKWYRNVAISEILLDTLEGFKMKYPKPKVDIKKMKVE